MKLTYYYDERLFEKFHSADFELHKTMQMYHVYCIHICISNKWHFALQFCWAKFSIQMQITFNFNALEVWSYFNLKLCFHFFILDRSNARKYF